ncbi:MAG: hypothetical protein WA484_00135 [Solirubrobacteraceae bacterium]
MSQLASGTLLQETDEWREYVGRDVVVETGEDFEDGFAGQGQAG